MGAGKTTIGACLADLLGWNFLDLDSEIEQRLGRSIPDLFRTDGEPRFREVEREILEQVLNGGSGPTVMALGGGTFNQAANRNLLQERRARTVSLIGDFELLWDRCSAQGDGRPLRQDREQFRELFNQRQPLYRSAELVVEVGSRTPQEIAAEIAAAVARWKDQDAVPE